MKEKLGIYTISTLKHSYALKAQARALHAACLYAKIKKPTIVIVCSDDDYFDEVEEEYRGLFNEIELFILKNDNFYDCDKRKNYKKPIQLMIAQMRTIATQKLLSAGCDRILSMDSDVLPKHNSIQCMLDILNFDHNYYDVAQCPYPSQGGGSFLGGRGEKSRQILPDFTEEEREIPKKLIAKRDKKEKEKIAIIDEINEKQKPFCRKTQDKIDKLSRKIISLTKKMESFPPKGNVFELNGKTWKKRGWFDFAYPAIGKGSVVPVDWVGFGCTMMSKKAAALCDFTGYDGSGTEDLYIIWNRWYQNSINIANIPHCPSDHIVRDRGDSNKYIHVFTYHEESGDHQWHLRQKNLPWYEQNAGEMYDKKNNGMHTIITEEEKNEEEVSAEINND